jgi:hypothetical protein
VQRSQSLKCVATLALGSHPKQGHARVRTKKEAWESHLMRPRVRENVRMNIHTPKWVPKILESDCRGSNPSPWGIIYIIEKLLKRRCLKWACMTHLNIWNTSYGQKKGRKSNWQFDSRPPKVENRPNFLTCRWRATYRWKALDEGYNFALDLISIRGMHTKLWGPKVVGIPTLAISALPFGNPETKCHLDVGFV